MLCYLTYLSLLAASHLATAANGILRGVLLLLLFVGDFALPTPDAVPAAQPTASKH